MTLPQELEHLFGRRILSHAEIARYMHTLSAIGKIDEPKKIALITLLLQRVAALEDSLVLLERKLEERHEPVEQKENLELSYADLVKKAKEAGVYTFGMKKDALKEALLAS